MGNNNALKRFLANKNTVTVLLVIVAVAVLYFAYNWRVSQATNPVSVPYAVKTIKPGVQITQDMVGTVSVPTAMLKGSVITSAANVIDKYSNADSVIPEGSLFYSRSVVEQEQLPANIILSYPNGYQLYNLAVDTSSTYGNSVYPGNYIDIWLKISLKDDTSNKVLQFGRLFQNVKILAVKDSSGQAVFADLDEQRTPAMIIFALPEEYFTLLKKAELLRTYDTNIMIVPTNESLKSNPGKVKLSNTDLQDWINEQTK